MNNKIFIQTTLFFAFFLSLATTAFAQPNAIITASRTSCVAPCAVFFDATGTTHTNPSIRPFHDLYYEWDFGDPSSSQLRRIVENFNHNKAKGAVAAHVFDPGFTGKGPNDIDVSANVDQYGFYVGPDLTYTINLQVKDAQGNMQNSLKSITVKGFSGKTYFVDAVNGNDNNPGTSEGQAWKTLSKAFSSTTMTNGDRMLFKRGDTFTFDSTLITVSGVYYGAYGAGTKPLFHYVGETTDKTAVWVDRTDVRLSDIKFNLTSPTGAKGIGIRESQNSFDNLFLRLVVEEFNLNGLQFNGPGPIERTFVVDSEFRRSATGQAVYVESDTLILLNNIVEDSGRHLLYLSHISGGSVISGNRLSRPSTGRHALRISGSWSVTSENIVVSDNIIEGWTNTWALVHFGPNADNSPHRMENVIFERNHVIDGQQLILIGGGYKNLTIRNNLFETKDTSIAPRLNIAEHVSASSDGSPPCKTTGSFGINIYGNTFVVTGIGPVLNILDHCNIINHKDIGFTNNIVMSTTQAQAISVSSALLNELESKNNLFYFPNNNQIFKVGSTNYDFNGWKSVSGEDAFSILADPLFINLNGTDGVFSSIDDNPIISSISPAIDAGTQVSVFDDFDGNPRPYGTGYDIGAFEYQSASSCVDMQSLLNYISQWKNGSLNMTTLMQKIQEWKAGTGC